jgi:uncharacterized coiled-coil protein SlyX
MQACLTEFRVVKLNQGSSVAHRDAGLVDLNEKVKGLEHEMATVSERLDHMIDKLRKKKQV